MQKHDFYKSLLWNYNFVVSLSIRDKLVFSARLGEPDQACLLFIEIKFIGLKK